MESEYSSDLLFLHKRQYEPHVDYLYRPFYQPNMNYVYKPTDHPGLDYIYKPKDQAHYGFLYEPIPDYLIPDRPPYRPYRSKHSKRQSHSSHAHTHKKCINHSIPRPSCSSALTEERKSIAKKNIEHTKKFPFLVDLSHVETITDATHKKISSELGYAKYEFSTIYVEKCSLFDAIMDVHKRNPESQICVLNSANSITPGGDYLAGQPTQEASLCRHTLLYPTLEGNKMYTANMKGGNEIDGSDIMIFSPNVSVFRDSTYKELIHPFKIDVISSTPVDNRKCQLIIGPRLMERRIRKIINLAASKKADILLLDSFGCGPLKNDPNLISEYFYKILVSERLKHYFPQIIFAINEDPLVFDIFRKRFNEH